MQFRDGATNIGNAVAVTNGTATRSATFGVGSHQLSAVFTPANTALYGASTSPPVTFTVDARPLVGAAAAVVPDEQDPPGDRGFQPREGLLPGLDDDAAIVGSAPLMLIVRRSRRAATR